MKQFIVRNKRVLGTSLALLLVGGIAMSFQDSPFSYNRFAVPDSNEISTCKQDTVPEGKNEGSIKMKDFDKLQAELDRSLQQLNIELKKIDLSGIQDHLESALKKIDEQKILETVERSLKSIDLDKTLATVGESLKHIDLEGENGVVEKAMKEAKEEIEKARKEIAGIDKEAIKKEMQEARKEIEKSKEEIRNMDMDKLLSEAKVEIGKAKEELKRTREMIEEMEKDGLVDSKKGFLIEYKDRQLYLDGKKQSREVTGKYRKYFKDEKDFKLRIEKE